MIAGYASAYGLFDLFLERIAYTEPHFDAIPGALFLKSCLDSSVSGTEIPDFDRLKALELEIEESHPGAQRESILPIFHGLIKKAQKLMFEHEKSNLENQFDPNSTEYFIAYSSLLKKGKELGII